MHQRQSICGQTCLTLQLAPKECQALLSDLQSRVGDRHGPLPVAD